MIDCVVEIMVLILDGIYEIAANLVTWSIYGICLDVEHP